MLHIILPMAGFGQRFRDAGYAEEKPLISVCGKTLLEWSLAGLRDIAAFGAITFHPIFRAQQPVTRLEGRLWRALQALFSQTGTTWKLARPVELFGPTQGAACTVLSVAVSLPPEDAVAVMNCDQYFEVDWADVRRAYDRGQWEGFILTFPGKGPSWSYAITNGESRVTYVIEKKANVSPHATVGFYFWRSASHLVRSICAMVATGQRTNNEYFLAPAYNSGNLSDHVVHIVPVKMFRGLGTPEQVQAFDESCTFREP